MTYIQGTELGWAIIFMTEEIYENLHINAEWPIAYRTSPFASSCQIHKDEILFESLCSRFSTQEARTESSNEFYTNDRLLYSRPKANFTPKENRIYLHIPFSEKVSEPYIKKDRFEGKYYVPNDHGQRQKLEEKFNTLQSIENWWNDHINSLNISGPNNAKRIIHGRVRIKRNRKKGPKEGSRYNSRTTQKMFAGHLKQGLISSDLTQDEIAQILSRTYLKLDYVLSPAAIKKHLFTVTVENGKRPTKEQVWNSLILDCQQERLL